LTRVGVARTEPTYADARAPYEPAERFPELERLFTADARPAGGTHCYGAFRSALQALGLDAPHVGTPEWNPLGDLVHEGGTVVLKPNFIRHFNPVADPRGTIESVITHGSALRALVDYAMLAVGASGAVKIAEAPQQDCDFDEIRRIVGLDELVRFYRDAAGRTLEVIDLRQEHVIYRDGVIVERRRLPGDPLGYRVVDLGARSFFTDSGLDPVRFRGADYDPGPTSEHHQGGRNEYLLSETVLSADLIVNLPKIKTHKKTGVTLALKNMVGINGDKNWLPHHSLGPVARGGDEFPRDTWIDRARIRATELARPLLARDRFVSVFRLARRAENALRGESFVRAGNWHGNRTTWRMCCDLNRCVYYSDRKGLHLDADGPVRTVLTVADGIVAGEGSGPLETIDRPLGVVLASTDPVALDLVAVRLMGFDERKIPKVWEPIHDTGPRITAVRRLQDVHVVEIDGDAAGPVSRSLDDLTGRESFRPHPGWLGHLERGDENASETEARETA
jgi:uncharacterized protein (DUF362 family)